MGSLDKKKKVLNNLKIVSNKINCKKKNLLLLHQIHSNKFYFIDKNKKFLNKKFKGDALITNKQKIALGILTADCAPIFIYDKKLKIISAIHSGWKGAYKGIVNNVINFLVKKGSRLNDLIAVIGPSIFQKNYEVQNTFKSKFIKKDSKSKKFFKTRRKKTYFSLNNYIYYQLKKKGIKKLEIIQKNTFDTKNNLFSARRSSQNYENDYGRNISIIMIK